VLEVINRDKGLVGSADKVSKERLVTYNRIEDNVYSTEVLNIDSV